MSGEASGSSSISLGLTDFEDLRALIMSTDQPDQPNSHEAIDNDISRYIGMVSREWAFHEHIMIAMVHTLLGVSFENAKVIFFAMNPPQRRDLISALSHSNIDDETVLAKVDAYLKEFDRLKTLRNDIVHGLWLKVPAFDWPLLNVIKSRATLIERLSQPEIEWIRETAEALRQLHSRASDLHQKIHAALHS